MTKVIRAFIFLFCLAGVANAQLLDTSIVENGKKYCFHKIQQGETLFQLKRVYGVPYSVLKENNPERGDELSIGDHVKIPCDLIRKNTAGNILSGGDTTNADAVLPPGYIWHLVAPKETIYGITRKYDITELRLKRDNPSIAVLGLKMGERIKIFTGDTVAQDTLATVLSIDSLAGDSVMLDSNATKIAVLLPFNWDKNHQKMLNTKQGEDKKILPYTAYFLDFYKGLRLSLDSLNKLGKNYQLFVYDTKADSSEVKKLVTLPQVQMANVVIGPAYPYNTKIASKALLGKPVKLICPYGRDDSIAIGRPNIVRFVSSKNARLSTLAKQLYNKHKHDRIIVVHNNEQEKVYCEQLQEELLGLSMMEDTNVMRTPVIVKGVYEPLSKLELTKRNVVVSFTTKESFATKLVSKLQTRQHEYEILVYGMQEWKDYKNIEIMHWDSLGIRIVGNLDYRYNGIKSLAFFQSYFNTYYCEPGYDALLAHDLCMSILAKQQHTMFSIMDFAGQDYQGELSNYFFKFNGPGNGIENKAVKMYRYHDFKFEEINE